MCTQFNNLTTEEHLSHVQVLSVINKAPKTFMYRYLYNHMFLSLWENYQEKITNGMFSYIKNLTAKLFSREVVLFYIPSAMYMSHLLSLNPHNYLLLLILFKI